MSETPAEYNAKIIAEFRANEGHVGGIWEEKRREVRRRPRQPGRILVRRYALPALGWHNGLIAPIVSTAEVSRPAEEVFAYVTDPSTFPEWQQGVVRGHMDGSPTRVGSKCTTIRTIGRREREVHTTITEYDPPRRWADRGVDGPVRAIVEVLVEPLADGSQSRVTINLDFTGHGIGQLLVPLLVRRQAAREMPENMRRLKQRLEARA